MKKSFLNRAMAAAIAVPVALSQTVLFTSFAAGETAAASDTTFTVDDFINVPVKDSVASPILPVSEDGDTFVYEKYSTGTSKMKTALNIMDDGQTYALDVKAILNSTTFLENKWYKDIIANAAVAEAGVVGDDIIITLNIAFDENNQNAVKDEVVSRIVDANSTLDKEIVKSYITTDVFANSTGTITLTIDTTKLADDGAVTYTVKAVSEQGEVKTVTELADYVESKVEAYRSELKADAKKIIAYYQAKLDAANAPEAVAAAQEQLDDAEYLLDTAVDKMVNHYNGKTEKYGTKIERRLSKNIAEKTYTKNSYDEVIAAVKAETDDALADGTRIDRLFDRVPGSLDEILNSKAVNDIYTEVINQINAIINQKGYAVEISLNDVVGVAKEAYNVTATGSLTDGNAKGYTEAYLADVLTSEESQYYYDYFTELLAEKLAAENKQIKSVDTEKKFEVNIGANYSTLSGSADLAIKRIITVTLEDATEESSEDTQDSSDDTQDSSEDTQDSSDDTQDSSEDESRPVAVEDINFDVDGDVDTNRNFYFSHDGRPFNPADLIRKATYTENTTLNGQTTSEVIDLMVTAPERFAFGRTADAPELTLSPKDVFTEENAYEQTRLYIFFQNDEGEWEVSDAELYVYIGVKGDANLNGKTDAADATAMLSYAAKIGAGDETAKLYNPVVAADFSDVKEALAWFLGDVTGESKDEGATSNNPDETDAFINSKDATLTLVYATVFGTKAIEANWVTDVFRVADETAVLPKYTDEIYAWEVENAQ